MMLFRKKDGAEFVRKMLGNMVKRAIEIAEQQLMKRNQ